MCTLSFYPTSNGYIFTHNRDEKPVRASQGVNRLYSNNGIIEYPKDKGAEGTWLFNRSDGLAAFLLNGAYEKHTKKEKYRLSRGLIMLDLARTGDSDSWIDQINLNDIEPFTMVIYFSHTIKELIWDGITKHTKQIANHKPLLWCSVTLYDKKTQLKRLELFERLIQNPTSSVTAHALLDIHLHGDIGDQNNNFRMKRSDTTQTLSVSQVILENGNTDFSHFDLPQDETLLENIIRNNNIVTNL